MSYFNSQSCSTPGEHIIKSFSKFLSRNRLYYAHIPSPHCLNFEKMCAMYLSEFIVSENTIGPIMAFALQQTNLQL
jgi:hypothetical protein